MPNDATFELMAGLQKSDATIAPMSLPRYNIDDIDTKFSMISLVYSGCFCLLSSKTIDPERPGMVYIDGAATQPPVIQPPMAMFGQIIGIFVRKYLHAYEQSYTIRLSGAYDTEGLEIPEYTFTLQTDRRSEPGEQYPEHDMVVLEAARESAVLLKNDNGALPLGQNAVVNVFGSGSVVFHVGCLGAGKINPRYSILVKEGIEKYSSLRINEELYEFYTGEKDNLPEQDILDRAKVLSDTAVVFVGRTSSEAHDNLPQKGRYYLTDDERTLLKSVSETFAKTVVILNTAYPIETSWVEEFGIDAVLLAGLPGMAGGRALAEILEGTVTPSGKLPNTWAKDYYDYPTAKNFLTLPQVRKDYPDSKFIATVYEEGRYVGYRYFDTFGVQPQWMFGHGLSYTSFEKKAHAITGTAIKASVEIKVTNTGSCAGKEVVQLYAAIPEEKLEQPRKRLIAFGKTKLLQPGESQILTLSYGPMQLRSFDEEAGQWILEAGNLGLYLGGSATQAALIYVWNIPEQIVYSKVHHRLPCPVPIHELSKNAPHIVGNTKGHSCDTLPHALKRETPAPVPELSVHSGDLITFTQVVREPSLTEPFVAQMNDYELARFSIGGKTGWGLGDSGFAGKLFDGGALSKYQLPDYFFADGNNGLNMVRPNIGFPVSTTMCASWNEELCYREGEAIAAEARGMKLNCLLAPALNLQRDPLCGRHTEYFSEDPLLAGRMAGQECRGFEENGVSGCMKHFFGNNAETMRNTNHSLMTERTARELYIAAFEYAFEVHQPDTVMTGYNAANGAYCSDDSTLLRGILREEMGFQGFVMTDWNGYGDQGFPTLLEAGVSWIAPGSEDDTFVTPVVEALASGALDRGLLQENLCRMVRVLIKYYRQGE